MRDINLKSIEHFEAVARLGSVTKAAEELGVSPSAVSQQIRALEMQLGVHLFRREKRRLILTLDGDRFFQTATHAFSSLRNARSAISRQHDVRNLAFRASPSFGDRWLGPKIAEFAEQNPEWNIRIDATPEFTSFETEAFDFDLRYGLGDWTGLTVQCVTNDLVMPTCSPIYLDKLRSHSHDITDQLMNARLIDSAKTIFRWDLWLASNRIRLPDLIYPFRFDRSSMSIEMAKQGGGLALDSVTLCLPELLRGELVPFAPEIPVIEFPAYWFVCPPRHFNRRIVRRFYDWLTKASHIHQQQAKQFLQESGCTFKTEKGPYLSEHLSNEASINSLSNE